jgi:outer membrane protein TolC
MKKILILVCLLLFPNSIVFADDYTFQDVVSAYLKNNRSIKALKDQRSAKEFLIKKSEGLLYPSVDVDINYNFLNKEPKIKTNQGNLPASEDKYLKGQLMLSYIIYDFGKRESIINQSIFDKNITELYLKKEINDQVFNIGKIFYQIISLKKTKEVYEEELKNLLEHKKRVDGFYEEGLVTKNEVLQIQLEISNTKQKILKTENDISNLERTLKLLTELESTINPIDTIEIDEKELLDSTIPEERPEVKIVRTLMKIKEEQLKSIESDYYPKLYAGTGINYEENRYRVDDYNFFITFGVKMNLFSGNSTKNEKFSVLKEISELNEKYRYAIEIVKTDFFHASNDYKTTKVNIDVAKEGVNQAEENLKIQQGKYEEHLIPVTDLIDATLLLTRANLNFILSVYENKIAYLKLLWSKGRIASLGGKNE